MYASLWMTSLREFATEYIQALEGLHITLLFLTNNVWNPSLIPSANHTPILTDIRLNKPNVYIPSYIKLLDLYQDSQVNVFKIDNQLVQYLTLPLFSREEYQLFKIHPLRSSIELNISTQLSLYIKPKTSYLTISSDNETYFTFSQQWLDSCSRYFFGYLYSPRLSIHFVEENPICETNLWIGKKSGTCEIYVSPNIEPRWIPLEKNNVWLYTMQPTQTIHSSCSAEISSSLESRIPEFWN